ncbi:MAG: hypothetical protein WAL25_14080 [Acidimicrobiia bacterium]
MSAAVTLGPDEVVSGRPFAAVEKTERDLGILHAILSDLRGVAVEVEEGVRVLEPYQKLVWRSAGYTHRLLVCSWQRVRVHPGLCVVGFFGDKRPDTDAWDLEEANSEIVGEFAKYPGILTYASVELPDGHWANMVLHDDPIDTQFWRTSKMHAKAVESLSPKHYFNVRIHNGHLTSSIFDRPHIVIEKTKYFDYTEREAWRAERTLAPG